MDASDSLPGGRLGKPQAGSYSYVSHTTSCRARANTVPPAVTEAPECKTKQNTYIAVDVSIMNVGNDKSSCRLRLTDGAFAATTGD